MRPILINATKRGTMMNELVVGDFLGQAVSAPSLAEQSRIGALFQKLDSLITLHQREGRACSVCWLRLALGASCRFVSVSALG